MEILLLVGSSCWLHNGLHFAFNPSTAIPLRMPSSLSHWWCQLFWAQPINQTLPQVENTRATLHWLPIGWRALYVKAAINPSMRSTTLGGTNVSRFAHLHQQAFYNGSRKRQFEYERRCPDRVRSSRLHSPQIVPIFASPSMPTPRPEHQTLLWCGWKPGCENPEFNISSSVSFTGSNNALSIAFAQQPFFVDAFSIITDNDVYVRVGVRSPLTSPRHVPVLPSSCARPVLHMPWSMQFADVMDRTPSASTNQILSISVSAPSEKEVHLLLSDFDRSRTRT